MKICIPTFFWKRPEVFEIFAWGVSCLKEELPEHQFHVLAVGSEGKKSQTMVERHGFEYFEFPNSPLSAKAHYRLQKARDVNAQAYLFLGSDDFVTPDYLRYAIEQINKGVHWIAPKDLWYIRNGSVYYTPGYAANHRRYGEPLAPGRVLTREVLDRVNWGLWNKAKDRGLDKDAYLRLLEATEEEERHFVPCQDTGGVVVDVKSNVNLSRWTPKHARMKKAVDLREHFGAKFMNLLKKVPDAK